MHTSLWKDLLPKERELKVVADFHKKLGDRRNCIAQHPILRSQAMALVIDKENKSYEGRSRPFPLNCERLGQWLGLLESVGGGLSSQCSERVLSQSSVEPPGSLWQ